VSKPQRIVFKGKGLELQQAWGPFAELFFDWQQLPPLDLAAQYYLVEIAPEVDTLPVEYARPNSEGPLHFSLKTGVRYCLSLLCASYPDYSIHSIPGMVPQVRLVPQHENRVRLIIGEDSARDLLRLSGEQPLEIIQDGICISRCTAATEVICDLVGRPASVLIKSSNGNAWVEIKTNLKQVTVIEKISFLLEQEAPQLSLATAIKPIPNWRVRAELPAQYRIGEFWRQRFRESYPDSNPAHVIGCFRFIENGSPAAVIRQWGYSTTINQQAIAQIQHQEWGLKNQVPPDGIKLQLQITSAHRELLKFVLIEKTLAYQKPDAVLGFSVAELAAAEQTLFKTNRHVAWEQAFLELVLWFKVEGRDWKEFQRDNAHSLRWDYHPARETESCQCEWLLFDLSRPGRDLVALWSGVERRINWPDSLYLKPFSQKHLYACWDLNPERVRTFIRDAWKVDLHEVGFFLKIHEEFLGKRIRRPDLDTQLIELFSEHRSKYFNVDPDKCFSAEIVARYKDSELALTPVSKSIVTPRISGGEPGHCNYERVSYEKFHCSQREVRHMQGNDSGNRAKIMLHLHLHSPNLHRADPFREGFLRDGTWPAVTYDGAEVHNPPGEWALKNCLDSWLPILRVLKTLARESVDYQVSLDISPPVAYMIGSPWFKDYFSRYLLRLKAYVDGQIARIEFRRDPEAYALAARQYRTDLDAIETFYVQELNKDMIGAFRNLELQGFIEISTCTATHGMPAELESVPDALDSQLVLATRSHQRIFGDRPKGIWLAENSYFPGVETLLVREELGYFFVEAEAVLASSEPPREEEFNPIVIPESNIVAFGRSRLGRTQVWDADLGYAGHPDFREYHFRHLGLPIKRITSKNSNDKQPYNPWQAEKTARELACDFFRKLRGKAEDLGRQQFKSIPLITCTYDAELFGHHWSEGPVFLEELLREIYRNGNEIGLTTPSHYLANHPVLPRTTPNPSTWGHDALHVKWSDPKVAWTFREIERGNWLLKAFLAKGVKKELPDLQLRMVEQMAAEFIRAQSSDLTFVIMSGDFEEDMQREILKYLDYFYRLRSMIDNRSDDVSFLRFRQYENGMFPEIPGYCAIRNSETFPD